MAETTATTADTGRDARSASGIVHWVGTGRSTGRGLTAVCDTAQEVMVWGRAEDRALACLRRVGAEDRAHIRLFDLDALTATLGPGDVVVSMVPAAEHPVILRRCVDQGAHFVCSSYTSEAIEAIGPEARAVGSVVLTEAGLDPGIDHLLAHDLIEQARAAAGNRPVRAEFTSYCGGLPAIPNTFRYRFSWAPAGVLAALRTPARYIEGGREHTANRPWEATRLHDVGGETFEAFPNRDSIPFIAAYALPSGWRVDTFIRGTLRLGGWRDAWSGVFPVIADGDEADITSLATDLARKHPMQPEDRDRVVLHVALKVRTDDGFAWAGDNMLDVVGNEHETAMAHCVSQTLACGVRAVLNGRLPAGIVRAASGDEASRWLGELRREGLDPRAGTAKPAQSTSSA